MARMRRPKDNPLGLRKWSAKRKSLVKLWETNEGYLRTESDEEVNLLTSFSGDASGRHRASGDVVKQLFPDDI